MTLRPLALAALTLVALTACASRSRGTGPQGPDPGAPVLGVAPFPAEGRDAAGAAQLDGQLRRGLGELGWNLADDLVTASLYQGIEDVVVYDPLTGEITEASFRARISVHGALATRFAAEGVVYAQIVPSVARFADGVATWDGVRQSIEGPDGVRDPLVRSTGYAGEVNATSLRVWIEDLEGNVVHDALAGLELTSILRGGRWLGLRRRDQLLDTGRVKRAVKLVLEQLPEAPES
ncbi:MAG: hypothetical protein AAF682_17450 [Planctomycetota bacterium]